MAKVPIGEGSVELALCVYSFGLPLDNACPLFLILAKAFTWLLPFEFGFSLNFFSVIFGAATCFICAHILFSLFSSIGISLLFSLLLAFLLWKISITISIWPLALFFFATSMYLFIRWYHTQRETTFILAVTAFSATLSIHSYFFLLLPLFQILGTIWLGQKKLDKEVFIGSFALMLLSLSIFLYIPFVSFLGSSFSMVNAQSFSKVFNYVFKPWISFKMPKISFKTCSYKGDNFPATYTKTISQSLKKNAIIIPSSKRILMYLLYGKFTNKFDKSTHILNPYKEDKEFVYLPFQADESTLSAVVKKYPNRNYYLTYTSHKKWHKFRLQRIGLVWQAIPASLGNFTKKKVKLSPFPSNKFSLEENRFLSQINFINGLDYLERSSIDKALEAFNKASFHQETLREMVVQYAKNLSSQRKYNKALKLYEFIKNRDTNIWLAMARLERARKNSKNMENYYKEVLKQNPKNFHALVELARFYEAQKKWDQAKKLYEILVKNYKNIAYPFRRLAALLAKNSENPKRIQKLMTKAAEIEKRPKPKQPKNPGIAKPKIPGVPHIGPKIPQVPRPNVRLPKIPMPKIPTPGRQK